LNGRGRGGGKDEGGKRAGGLEESLIGGRKPGMSGIKGNGGER